MATNGTRVRTAYRLALERWRAWRAVAKAEGYEWNYVPTSPRTDPYAPGYGRRLHPGMTTSQHRALCRADAWNDRRLRLEYPALRALRERRASYAAR